MKPVTVRVIFAVTMGATRKKRQTSQTAPTTPRCAPA